MSEPASRSASPPDALTAFIGKWRTRWPEWTIAEAFVPRSQREPALAWAALQQELTDAAWGGSDARPGEAKLLWWQEELHGWAAGRRRHPLGSVLQRRSPAPWAALAANLPALAAGRERPQDLERARSTLDPFARIAAMIDWHLSGNSAAGSPSEVDVAAVTATLLQARCLHDGDSHVPLSLLALAGDADPVALYARHLAQHWPAAQASTRPRRLWAALARARLDLADPRSSLPPWQALPLAWRAARAGGN